MDKSEAAISKKYNNSSIKKTDISFLTVRKRNNHQKKFLPFCGARQNQSVHDGKKSIVFFSSKRIQYRYILETNANTCLVNSVSIIIRLLQIKWKNNKSSSVIYHVRNNQIQSSSSSRATNDADNKLEDQTKTKVTRLIESSPYRQETMREEEETLFFSSEMKSRWIFWSFLLHCFHQKHV